MNYWTRLKLFYEPSNALFGWVLINYYLNKKIRIPARVNFRSLIWAYFCDLYKIKYFTDYEYMWLIPNFFIDCWVLYAFSTSKVIVPAN